MGARVWFFPFKWNEYWLRYPSWDTFRLNCHSLSSKRWPACIRTTSHFNSSTYRTMEKGIKTCFVTLTFLLSFSYCSRYSLRFFSHFNPSFSTKVVLAILVQLPLSIIIIHTFPSMRHCVWKIFSHCSKLSFFTCMFNARLTTSDSSYISYSIFSSSKQSILSCNVSHF